MADMTPEFVKTLVETTQNVTLEDAATARIAGSIGAAMATLDRIAGDSLFDTEPAGFARTLVEHRGEGGEA